MRNCTFFVFNTLNRFEMYRCKAKVINVLNEIKIKVRFCSIKRSLSIKTYQFNQYVPDTYQLKI